MKVLITTDWYAPVINGVVTSVLMLRRELEARGHEVRIVTLSNSMHSYKDGNVYYMGSVSANRIYPGARLKMNRAGSLLRELADWQPDVIHSQCEFSTFRVASALSNRLGTPIVHTYHTVYEDYTHYLYLSRRVGRYVVTAFSRWICGHTACIVAPTRKVEQLLRRYGVHCRIEVIPTGVDLRSFRENDNPQAREALRRQWDVAPEDYVLGILARLEDYKGHVDILQALAILRDEGRPVKLVIAGVGPYEQRLREETARLGLEAQVRFLGFVTDVAPLLSVLDLQLNASYGTETSSLSILEGMSMGLPAVVSDYGGNPWLIDDGEDGLLFPTRDASALARAVARLMDDRGELSRMGERAAEIFRQRFTGEIFAQNIENVYLDTLKGAK